MLHTSNIFPIITSRSHATVTKQRVIVNIVVVVNVLVVCHIALIPQRSVDVHEDVTIGPVTALPVKIQVSLNIISNFSKPLFT